MTTAIEVPQQLAPPGNDVGRSPASRWAILGVVALAQLMVVLDSTVVNIALPSAQEDLGFSNGDRQWIVTAYALAFGSLLPLGGRLADLFGRRRMFLIGLVGFAGASAVGGAAVGFPMLVSARAVQGGFGAMLAPAGLALLTTTFTESRERAKAFGIYGAIAGAGAAIGLLLGGVLTQYLSWRYCMYVNLIFAVGAVTGGALLLRHEPSDTKPVLDLPGVITATAGLFFLVFGFSHAETGGWAAPETVSFLAGGVALLVAFVAIQARSAHPLLPLRIFADRYRSGAYVAILTAGAGMFGVFLFLTYFLQSTEGYSAIRSGLAFLPMTGMLVVMAAVTSSQLAWRVGPKYLVAPGMLLGAVGLMLLHFGIGLHASYLADILPGTLIIGVGLGLAFAVAPSMATVGVRADDAGVASSLVSTGQQVGGSIGTALLNTLCASAIAAYATSHHATTATALAQASVHGYDVAFGWSALIFVVGAVVCALLLPGRVATVSDGAGAVPVV